MLVGQHVGLVNAGEGLVLGVLEKARRAHGDWILNGVEEGEQVVADVGGEFCGEETPRDFVVVVALDGEVVKLVLGKEAVEDSGSEYERWRHSDADAGESLAEPVIVQQVTDECEAAGLAA